MEKVILTREVLELFDKYHGDFGLMEERWACKEDRQRLTLEQTMLFSEYIYNLEWLKTDPPYVQMKADALRRNSEIEKVMDPEVIEILRKRMLER